MKTHDTRKTEPHSCTVAESVCGTNWSPQVPVIGLALCTKVDYPFGELCANTSACTGTTQTARDKKGMSQKCINSGHEGSKRGSVYNRAVLSFWGPGAFPACRRPGLPGDHTTAGSILAMGKNRISLVCARTMWFFGWELGRGSTQYPYWGGI